MSSVVISMCVLQVFYYVNRHIIELVAMCTLSLLTLYIFLVQQVMVKGHADCEGNKVADKLATDAAKRGLPSKGCG